MKSGSHWAEIDQINVVESAFMPLLENKPDTNPGERLVRISFMVIAPEGAGASVYLTGNFDQIAENLPRWKPDGIPLVRLDASIWRVVLLGRENTRLEYKYILGSWDTVEKDSFKAEIGNRHLEVKYGDDGSQNVQDVVQAWAVLRR